MAKHYYSPLDPADQNYGLCRCGCGNPTPIATGHKRSVGHVRGQPMHFVRGHQNRLRTRLDLKKVIEESSFPDPNTGCFIWAGAMMDNGYGQFSIRGKTMTVHRAAWILEHGEVPRGLEVMHSCHRQDCVSLAHLSLGTHAQNMHDMHRLERGRRGAYPRGVKKNGNGWAARTAIPGGKGKAIHLGTYDTIEEAAAVVAAKRAELFAAYKAQEAAA